GVSAAQGLCAQPPPAAHPRARSDREPVAAPAAGRHAVTLSARQEPFTVADPLHEIMELQMGPSHPASHGTIKFNLKLDGETIVGARLTVSYCRLGGLTNDLPARFGDVLADRFRKIRAVVADCDKLLTRNRIFVDRMSGVGLLSQDDAISYGLTGPLLRATGVNYDVRKQCPYLYYDQGDFEVPPGTSKST